MAPAALVSTAATRTSLRPPRISASPKVYFDEVPQALFQWPIKSRTGVRNAYSIAHENGSTIYRVSTILPRGLHIVVDSFFDHEYDPGAIFTAEAPHEALTAEFRFSTDDVPNSLRVYQSTVQLAFWRKDRKDSPENARVYDPNCLLGRREKDKQLREIVFREANRIGYLALAEREVPAPFWHEGKRVLLPAPGAIDELSWLHPVRNAAPLQPVALYQLWRTANGEPTLGYEALEQLCADANAMQRQRKWRAA